VNGTCTCCGKPTSELSVRAGLPDAMLSLPQHVRDAFGDPYTADTLPAEQDGRAYIRALLRIPLTGKHPEMLYCLWVEASENDVRHAMDVWNDDDEYAKVSMHGYLANRVASYGLLGADLTIAVRDPSQLPYIDSSSDRTLTSILTEPQPYEMAVPVI
jgi:hypothetical protein